MRNLKLNFNQRTSLVNFLSNATGPLGKITELQKVFVLLNYTDSERGQIKTVEIGAGIVSVIPPSPEFGLVEVQVEDASAETVLQEIQGFSGFRVTDVAWIDEVKTQLGRKL